MSLTRATETLKSATNLRLIEKSSGWDSQEDEDSSSNDASPQPAQDEEESNPESDFSADNGPKRKRKQKSVPDYDPFQGDMVRFSERGNAVSYYTQEVDEALGTDSEDDRKKKKKQKQTVDLEGEGEEGVIDVVCDHRALPDPEDSEGIYHSLSLLTSILTL